MAGRCCLRGTSHGMRGNGRWPGRAFAWRFCIDPSLRIDLGLWAGSKLPPYLPSCPRRGWTSVQPREQAGTHDGCDWDCGSWVPAFAGMTLRRLRGRARGSASCPELQGRFALRLGEAKTTGSPDEASRRASGDPGPIPSRSWMPSRTAMDPGSTRERCAPTLRPGHRRDFAQRHARAELGRQSRRGDRRAPTARRALHSGSCVSAAVHTGLDPGGNDAEEISGHEAPDRVEPSGLARAGSTRPA